MSIPCRVNSLYATNSVTLNSSSHELCSCSWKSENLCCLTHNIPQQWPRSNHEHTLSLGWCWSHQEATLCIIKLQFRGRDDLGRTPSFLPRKIIGGCVREWNLNHSSPTSRMATLSGILLFGLRSRRDKNTGILLVCQTSVTCTESCDRRKSACEVRAWEMAWVGLYCVAWMVC